MARFTRDILPGAPLIEAIELPPGLSPTELVAQVLDCHGEQILGYRPSVPGQPKGPPPAQEPPPPEEIASSDELYLVGLHLEQYRHATRWPTPYWREALRRDPLDARSNNALGLWHLRRGEFRLAEPFFRRAIQRLTGHNANPYDGEPFYNLGLCLRHQIDAGDAADDLFADAYAAFSKATWNQAWSGAGYHALAEMDCRRGHWATALEHLDRALGRDRDNLRVRDLRSVVLRKLGRQAEAQRSLADTLAMDPLDWWARQLAGEPMTCDLQVLLDLAHDYARAGLYAEAVALLGAADGAGVSTALPTQSWGAAPLVDYTLGWLHQRLGDQAQAEACYRRASALAPDYCFPARLEEIAVLQAAADSVADDARRPTTSATCSTIVAATKRPSRYGSGVPGSTRTTPWSGGTWALATSTCGGGRPRRGRPMRRPSAPTRPAHASSTNAISSGSGWGTGRPSGSASWNVMRSWSRAAMI